MADQPMDQERQDAATEAAQNVVDDVTSWEYSAQPETIESRLDEGLQEAEVEIDDQERQRVVNEIDAVKTDETRGAPSVASAAPTQGPAES